MALAASAGGSGREVLREEWLRLLRCSPLRPPLLLVLLLVLVVDAVDHLQY